MAFWISSRPIGKLVQYTRVDDRDFIFIKYGTRANKKRGQTAFKGGYWLFDQVLGYLQAVVMAARAGASQAIIIKRHNPGSALMPNVPGGTQPNMSPAAMGPGGVPMGDAQSRTRPILQSGAGAASLAAGPTLSNLLAAFPAFFLVKN